MKFTSEEQRELFRVTGIWMVTRLNKETDHCEPIAEIRDKLVATLEAKPFQGTRTFDYYLLCAAARGLLPHTVDAYLATREAGK